MGHVDQTDAAVRAMRDIFGDRLTAVYLHGSAVSGGLRRYSDLDLLAIIDRDMTDDQRRTLTAALLHISGRYPAALDGPRCLEVVIFRRSDLFRRPAPARTEFTYGEWLRADLEAGELPGPAHNPENTILLAQARRSAILLTGQNILTLLPDIPAKEVRQAMQTALPALLETMGGDERNVLLTLARMWYTASTGEFVSKEVAADWATQRLPPNEAATLTYARQTYAGLILDNWGERLDEARDLAARLEGHIVSLLRTDQEDVPTF